MSYSVAKEYLALLEKKRTLECELRSLPVGYISKKTIKGNVRYYLQHREGSKIVGTYIRNDDVDKVREAIERRNAILAELPAIDERLSDLERAAKIIGNRSTITTWYVRNMYVTLMMKTSETRRMNFPSGRPKPAILK